MGIKRSIAIRLVAYPAFFLLLLLLVAAVYLVFFERLGDFGDPLLNAAHTGDLDLVRDLLKSGKNPNLRDGFGNCPLTVAADAGQTEVVKFLLEHGAKLDVADDAGETPLHCAARNGHLETAEFLVKRGASVNATDRHGVTALMAGVQFGNVAVVELLLANKADLTKRDTYGWQALHIVLRSNNVNRPDRYAVVKALLMNGADPHADNPGGSEHDSEHDSMGLPSFSSQLPNKGNTPRAIATSNGFEDIAELLQASPSKPK